MERTTIQENIERIVSNGLVCASPFEIKSSRLETIYWKEFREAGEGDSKEDLQRRLCSMEWRTAKSYEESMFFYREWLKMMNNLYLKFMKVSEECLSA